MPPSSPDPLNPYPTEHLNPQGEGDARPTALQIIHDDDLTNAFPDKVMLVTGSSSGIGIETVRALHATGAHLFMQVRDMKRGQEVLEDILASSVGEGKLELLEMELGSFESIRAGVKEFLKRTPGGKLNVLVNNAGIRNPPEGTTADGFETQFGVNHLSHFLLFQLLCPLLLSSSTPTFASRVINVSSGAHRRSSINFSNPNLKGIYNPRIGYAQSKTANILMANQIERLYGSKGVHAFSVSPGMIESRAQRYDDPGHLEEVRKVLGMKLKNAEQGAANTVWAAVGKVWEGKGGLLLEEMSVATLKKEGDINEGGYAEFAFDEEAEKKLWDMSCEMVGVGTGA